MGRVDLFIFVYFHHMLTLLVLYLLFTGSSSTAQNVLKDINEILLNSIFAPCGFAEAVAPLKQSVVPSGHCGFAPTPFLLCVGVSSPDIPRVPLGGCRDENDFSRGASEPCSVFIGLIFMPRVCVYLGGAKRLGGLERERKRGGKCRG